MLRVRAAPTPQRRHPDHHQLAQLSRRRSGTAAAAAPPAAAGAASASGDAGVKEKGRTQRIMEAMPSSQQAMGAGGSSTYQVRRRMLSECSLYLSVSLSLCARLCCRGVELLVRNLGRPRCVIGGY